MPRRYCRWETESSDNFQSYFRPDPFACMDVCVFTIAMLPPQSKIHWNGGVWRRVGWRRMCQCFQFLNNSPRLTSETLDHRQDECLGLDNRLRWLILLPWPKQACPLSFFLLLNLSVIKCQEISKQPNGAKRRAIIAKNSCGVHWGFQKVRDTHGCEWTSDLPAVGEGGSSYRTLSPERHPLSGTWGGVEGLTI